MSSDFTYTMNGVDLDTALGAGFISDVSVWRPPITTRRSSLILPGEHGVINPQLPVFEEPTVTIGIRVIEADQGDLEERANHVRALFTQPALVLGRTSGGLTTSAVAQLVSLNDEDYLVGSTDRIIVILAIPGVFFRGPVVTSPDIPFAANLTNQEIAELTGSTAPIIDSIIRVKGPASSVNITDPLTATGISWAGSLLINQYLFLQARPLAARISSNAGDWTAGGTSELARVDYPGPGRLMMWPVVQSATARKVLLNASGGGRTAGQTQLTVRAARSYF